MVSGLNRGVFFLMRGMGRISSEIAFSHLDFSSTTGTNIWSACAEDTFEQISHGRGSVNIFNEVLHIAY